MKHMKNYFVSGVMMVSCLFLYSGYVFAGNSTRGASADYLRVEKALTRFAGTLARKQHLDKKTVFALLSGYVKKNPEIYGAAFAFAPEVKHGKLIKSSP